MHQPVPETRRKARLHNPHQVEAVLPHALPIVRSSQHAQRFATLPLPDLVPAGMVFMFIPKQYIQSVCQQVHRHQPSKTMRRGGWVIQSLSPRGAKPFLIHTWLQRA